MAQSWSSRGAPVRGKWVRDAWLGTIPIPMAIPTPRQRLGGTVQVSDREGRGGRRCDQLRYEEGRAAL
jgi:hypothetical protein